MLPLSFCNSQLLAASNCTSKSKSKVSCPHYLGPRAPNFERKELHGLCATREEPAYIHQRGPHLASRPRAGPEQGKADSKMLHVFPETSMNIAIGLLLTLCGLVTLIPN